MSKMSLSGAARLVSLAAVVAALGACAKVRTHQGYLIDRLLVDSVAVGTDNRDSVEGALGHPTFATQFGPEEWYYVSRDTRALAYRSPKPVDQTVIRVRFDAAGTVSGVERIGMAQVARIDPVGDKTPTLGRHRGLFQELFGNIGAVGTGPGGGSAGGGSTGGGGPNGS